MREQGWHVVDAVKETKPQRLGLLILNTEIDAGAGHADTDTIWLTEAKDPVDVYAIPNIRRHLDRFLDSSKKRGGTLWPTIERRGT
ncbi:hypothetical protein [Nocardia sp. NRRL S-836]|uniref:hypothetical protein n=1 Tax=Nocardia sp. NRRL S-836 TaxID=1519492 RepID=UPI0012FC63C4|nr:hypothetical protein [Nocardia sp. NRRL S-836]